MGRGRALPRQHADGGPHRQARDHPWLARAAHRQGRAAADRQPGLGAGDLRRHLPDPGLRLPARRHCPGGDRRRLADDPGYRAARRHAGPVHRHPAQRREALPGGRFGAHQRPPVGPGRAHHLAHDGAADRRQRDRLRAQPAALQRRHPQPGAARHALQAHHRDHHRLRHLGRERRAHPLCRHAGRGGRDARVAALRVRPQAHARRRALRGRLHHRQLRRRQEGRARSDQEHPAMHARCRHRHRQRPYAHRQPLARRLPPGTAGPPVPRPAAGALPSHQRRADRAPFPGRRRDRAGRRAAPFAVHRRRGHGAAHRLRPRGRQRRGAPLHHHRVLRPQGAVRLPAAQRHDDGRDYRAGLRVRPPRPRPADRRDARVDRHLCHRARPARLARDLPTERRRGAAAGRDRSPDQPLSRADRGQLRSANRAGIARSRIGRA